MGAEEDTVVDSVEEEDETDQAFNRNRSMLILERQVAGMRCALLTTILVFAAFVCTTLLLYYTILYDVIQISEKVDVLLQSAYEECMTDYNHAISQALQIYRSNAAPLREALIQTNTPKHCITAVTEYTRGNF